MFMPPTEKFDRPLLLQNPWHWRPMVKTFKILNTLKGDRLSHDSRLDIDHDVSTA